MDEDEGDEEEEATICAFCLMTSAGVRMAQETSSATEDAVAYIRGVGISPFGGLDVCGLSRDRSAFVRSYVVKNAPAIMPCSH